MARRAVVVHILNVWELVSIVWVVIETHCNLAALEKLLQY